MTPQPMMATPGQAQGRKDDDDRAPARVGHADERWNASDKIEEEPVGPNDQVAQDDRRQPTEKSDDDGEPDRAQRLRTLDPALKPPPGVREHGLVGPGSKSGKDWGQPATAGAYPPRRAR